MGVLRVLFFFKFVLSPQDTETKVIKVHFVDLNVGYIILNR